jgi:N-acyl-D-aspartate/D-glutamate deacylase
LAQIEQIGWRMFKLGEVPNYEPSMGDSLGAQAAGDGESVLAAMYDALLEDEGRSLLYFPLYNYTEGSLDNVAEMMNHAGALPGLSDGGAHVGTICDASFPTFMLTWWVRDRPHGRISLPDAIHRMTQLTAQYIGLNDRGVVAPGMKADLNVIDVDKLQLTRPELVADLPAGGKRLMQPARGYKATLVSGEVIVLDGVFTGALPGRMVRS